MEILKVHLNLKLDFLWQGHHLEMGQGVQFHLERSKEGGQDGREEEGRKEEAERKENI